MDVVTTRHAYCVRHNIVYALVSPDGQVIGTAALTIVAASEPSPTSTRWQESISVLAGAMSPTIPAMKVSLRSDCTQCIAGPPAWGGGYIELHQGEEDHTGTLSYDSTVRGGGLSQRTQISYQSEVVSTGANPVTSPRTGRVPRCAVLPGVARPGRRPLVGQLPRGVGAQPSAPTDGSLQALFVMRAPRPRP